MLKQLLLLAFLLVIPSYVLAGGCCLNPKTVACDYVDKIDICCKGDTVCEDTLFYPGNYWACAELPPEMAEECETGCCCREGYKSGWSESMAACSGRWETWIPYNEGCVCEETPADADLPDDTETTIDEPDLPDEEPYFPDESPDDGGVLQHDDWVPDIPPGSVCHQYGGICKFSIFGYNPCYPETALLNEAECGMFSKCCKLGRTDISSNYNSISSYELVHIEKVASSGKAGLSFTIPEKGTLWAKLTARNIYLSANQYSRLVINGQVAAEVKNGEKALEISVNPGDFVFADANGYTCFFFLCMSSASIDLAFGTLRGEQLGTDTEVESLGMGLTQVYAGEGSPSPVEKCSIDWGDGNSENVPTEGNGKIRLLSHVYDSPTPSEVSYTCSDANGVSSTGGSVSSNEECFTPADCWENSVPIDCIGEWTCEEGSCVLDCEEDLGDLSEQVNQPAQDTRDAAMQQCIQYCNSDDPNTQAKFFAMNPELEVFKGELEVDNSDCTALMQDISKCSNSFKDEFNALLDRMEEEK